MASTTLFLGNVARVQGLDMTVISGRKLNIVEAPTSEQNAANKAYVDLKAKEVQDALNLVTAGSNVSFDTLLELKNLSDSVKASGASDLSTAISTEVSRATTIESSLRTDLTTEDARATAAEFRLQTMNVLSSTTMLYVPTVYADSTSFPTPLEQCSYTVNTNAANFDGWRMRNAVQGNKFNFYVPSTGLKVGDVKAMYLEACMPSVVSMPFITFYTVKKGDAGEGSWYRSKATYIRNDTDVLVAGSKYNMVANLKSISNVHSSNYFTQHNLILDTFSSRNTANMGDTDDILFFAISSDSSSSAGNMECIISKFKVQLSTGIHEFVFSNTHVFADYMKRKQSQLWNSLYGTSSSDDPFINDFQIPARSYS
jgi:hypothetical protein